MLKLPTLDDSTVEDLVFESEPSIRPMKELSPTFLAYAPLKDIKLKKVQFREEHIILVFKKKEAPIKIQSYIKYYSEEMNESLTRLPSQSQSKSILKRVSIE